MVSKKNFLFNPKKSKETLDIFSDENPEDTIHIKYATIDDVKNTIKKLERLYKDRKYPHKRIWQVGMIMMVRLRLMKDTKREQYRLANRYHDFLSKRTRLIDEDRYKLTFKI